MEGILPPTQEKMDTLKKAAEAENEKTEGNADANTSEEPSDEAEEANETAEGESEEKNDGSEN